MKESTLLIVKDLCKSTLSNADGVSLKIAIVNSLKDSKNVLISFKGIDSISSSFLNSSIGEVVDEMHFDVLRNRIKITSYTSHLAVIIQNYISSLKLLKA